MCELKEEFKTCVCMCVRARAYCAGACLWCVCLCVTSLRVSVSVFVCEAWNRYYKIMNDRMIGVKTKN